MNKRIVFDLPPVRGKICRHGAMMYMPKDIFVGRSLDLYGEYCQGEIDLFAQLIRPGMAVIDIGANIGPHTVYFAKTVGPGGHVTAFEPQRHIYHMLCGNIALNGLTNVVAHQAGVGRVRAKMTVPHVDYTAVNNFGGLALGPEAAGGDQVPVFSIDWLEPDACHFIKVDVEGMEQQVLEGSARTLERHKPLLYVENDRDSRSPGLIRFLFNAGYRAYWHVTPLFNQNNYYGNADDIFPNVSAVNLLCAHKSLNAQIGGLPEVRSEADWPSIVNRGT